MSVAALGKLSGILDVKQPEHCLGVPAEIPGYLVSVYGMAVYQGHTFAVVGGDHREVHDPSFLLVGDQIPGFQL